MFGWFNPWVLVNYMMTDVKLAHAVCKAISISSTEDLCRFSCDNRTAIMDKTLLFERGRYNYENINGI